MLNPLKASASRPPPQHENGLCHSDGPKPRLGVSLHVPGVPPRGVRGWYSPWVSHSNSVPPHREVTDQSFRRWLFPFIAVQVHCPVSLGRQDIEVLKYNVRIKQEASTEAQERPCRGQRVYLTSTIWFSGLMSWTCGTLMLMVLPVCSACWAGRLKSDGTKRTPLTTLLQPMLG